MNEKGLDKVFKPFSLLIILTLSSKANQAMKFLNHS